MANTDGYGIPGKERRNSPLRKYRLEPGDPSAVQRIRGGTQEYQGLLADSDSHLARATDQNETAVVHIPIKMAAILTDTRFRMFIQLSRIPRKAL